MAYSLAAEYFTSVGAVFTSRRSASERREWNPSRPCSSGIVNDAASASSTRASSCVTFHAGAAAAALSLSPSPRTSANSLASSREIWFSSVRALTICPSEVLVASGSR